MLPTWLPSPRGYGEEANPGGSLEPPRLINIAGSILERPVIKSQFTHQYEKILDILEVEFKVCQDAKSDWQHLRMRERNLWPATPNLEILPKFKRFELHVSSSP
ncbi:hypothetical protein NQ315_013786 [Exocentrus adspersus]|uniref:Uncharacterized protein n=1 Tax=Exocentrus adspersus TaxID=1586481 RepID=A0AAV8W4S3_9CUCU|nr:hypothetical protein NQ315_013786 [Exocentrus adspersus]